MMKNESCSAKPKWVVPMLIVLMRGSQDELVLAVCKGPTAGGPPTLLYSGCHNSALYGGCTQCSNQRMT